MFNLSDLHLAQEVERKLIEVPEVLHKGEPLSFFVSEMTCREMDKITKKHKDLGSMEAMIEVIIMKAQDENGEKAFSLEHKPFFMNRDPKIVARIFNQVFNAIGVEEHEKN